jgi:hypothetical protein
MSTALSLLTAVGAAAIDMSTDTYTAWLPTKIGQPVSFQVANPAGMVGAWKVQGTNEGDPTVAATASTVSSELYWGAPAQPGGTACETSITLQATHENMRLWYDCTSGGVGVLATGNVGVGASGVLIMPPNLAIVPASSSAALAILVAIQAALSALATNLTAVASGVVQILTIADNEDPATGDGIAAGINSMATTADGTKGWIKTGSANTDWSLTNGE